MSKVWNMRERMICKNVKKRIHWMCKMKPFNKNYIPANFANNNKDDDSIYEYVK